MIGNIQKCKLMAKMNGYLSVNIMISFRLVEGVDDGGMSWMDANILVGGR